MNLERRAAQHAALGDITRLAIVEELARSDRSPGELGRMFGLPSNLLAHHLDVLEGAGVIHRRRSEGDGRRRYLTVRLDLAATLGVVPAAPMGPVLFVCTHNSARSQMAAAAWHRATGARTESAGTHPAARVHPGALAAARRAGLEMPGVTPRHLRDVADLPALVVTVCDRAHEELPPSTGWWHWSIADPVRVGSAAAFDTALARIVDRITALNRGGRAA